MSVKVLLVDDQAIIGEAIRRMLASSPDIEFHYCGDATKALETAVALSPTVILQDLVMPDVDGLTLLRFFRGHPATRAVPTIVLSSKEDPKVKAEAFALGANDYLVKLPDAVELVARIRHHSAGYVAQLERAAAYDALKKSEERLAKELGQAAKYVISLLPERLMGEITTDWSFIPSAQLGGDSFGYHWIDADHFAMYLLDVCGHGVRAALLSVSAMNVVRTHAVPGVDFRDPSQVLAALNTMFDMDRHDGMFFTMWYGVYVKSDGRVRFASAGHPPAVLIGPSGVTELQKNGMVIGGMPGLSYESATHVVERPCRLYLLSDGAYEIERPDGAMWTFEEFVQVLRESGAQPDRLAAMIARLIEIRGRSEFDDDVSIVEIAFGI
jgi:sigma-B regulation protein RsbU (phosphoserine phosphatase)